MLAFTDAQLAQIRMTATQIPRRLRDAYLQRVVQLLNGRDFGDADVWRAARAAAGEIMHVLGHGVLLCPRCPSPAWPTGRAGARPDHPISG